MKNYKKWLVGSLVAFTLVLTACGTGGKTTDKTDDSGIDSTMTADKSTFTYGISADPSSTNPINSSDRWGLTLNNMLYSPLVRVETDGTETNVLAEAVEPGTDGLSVTVKLKKDIKWSDGEAFTADDVVFTYEQKVKKENGNADQLWISDQPINVEKVDDQTVKFILPSTSAAALSNIVTETVIIPEHVYKDVKDFSVTELPGTPVGTGPYKLKEYKRGEYIALEANENYFDGEPAIKNLVLRIIENTDTAKVALQKGEIDATFVLPSDIADLDDTKITAYPYSENRVGYLGLNNATDELKDVKVRQAVLYALNKGELNKAAYLSEEYYAEPVSFLPPNNPFATTEVETYATDVEKSKELLKEAGVSELKLNIAFTAADPVQSVQATLIQQQLKQAGIDVTLEGGDGTAIYSELSTAGSTKYNLFLGGYIMGNDADLYSALFHSGGSSNTFQFNNKKTDELFDAAAVELDPAKRLELYKELQLTVIENAPIYPIVDNKKVLAVNNRIGNVTEAGLIPIYTFEDVSKLIIK